MPSIPKTAFAYRLSQVTSLGKRKRSTPETPPCHEAPPPSFGIVTHENEPSMTANHGSNQHEDRRRQFSLGRLHLSDLLKLLRKDSAQDPDPVETMIESAIRERTNAPPDLNTSTERLEGRANIPNVGLYLDSRTQGEPSNFYNTREYKALQDPSSSDISPRRKPRAYNSSQSSAGSHAPGTPVTPESAPDRASIFPRIPRFSRPSPDTAESHVRGRKRSWSPSKAIDKLFTSQKSRGKRPAKPQRGESPINVPPVPEDTVLPVTIVPGRPHARSDAVPIPSNTSNSRGSCPKRSNHYQGLDSEFNYCLTGRPAENESYFPSPEPSAEDPLFDMPQLSTSAASLSLRPTTPTAFDNSLADLRPNTGGGRTPNGRHLISRSTSDEKMTFPMSPCTSRHDLAGMSGTQQSATEPDNYPTLPFDMTRRQSAQVHASALLDGTEIDHFGPSVNGVTVNPFTLDVNGLRLCLPEP